MLYKELPPKKKLMKLQINANSLEALLLAQKKKKEEIEHTSINL